MNNQDWFPLGWTGWISLQSKGLPRVFPNTTVQKHQFFGAHLSVWSNFLLIYFIFINLLSLICIILITLCLSVFLLGLILSETLCASWTWLTISFTTLKKVSAIIYSNIFSSSFCLSLFSFWDLYNQMLVHLMLSQRTLRLSSFFHSFFYIRFMAVISPTLSSRSLLPQLFCCWFLLVYCLFLFACSIVLLGLWLTFLASSPLFSQDPRSSALSLFSVLFLKG